MSKQIQKYTSRTYLQRESVQKKFNELLGEKAQGFVTSVLQIIASNDMLSEAEPSSVYNAAMTAAVLDLPLNNNLGFAYIIPYRTKQRDGSYKVVAQFQMGYKGFIQLCQRSGQFRTISATPIYEGQLVEEDPLMGFQFDWKAKESDRVIGYASYFELLNGFRKTFYMTREDVEAHARAFSKNYSKPSSIWKQDFDSMAIKTVLKLLLSKFAPMSVEMQRAVISDQAEIKDADTMEVGYIDNEEVEEDPVAGRIQSLLTECTTMEQIEALEEDSPEGYENLFEERKAEIEEVAHVEN